MDFFKQSSQTTSKELSKELSQGFFNGIVLAGITADALLSSMPQLPRKLLSRAQDSPGRFPYGFSFKNNKEMITPECSRSARRLDESGGLRDGNKHVQALRGKSLIVFDKELQGECRPEDPELSGADPYCL